MVTPSSFIPVLKYGFLTLVVSCAGYLIASITVFKHIDGVSIADLLVRHQISMQTEGVTGVLDKGFERCLTHPSSVFCLMTAHKHFGQHLHLEDTSENVTTPEPEIGPRIHPVFKALRSFSKLARNLNFTSVLLDPSLLFCLLNPTSKTLLLKNGFNPTRFQSPKNSVIMGVDEDGGRILNGSMMRILRGFKQWSKVARDAHFLPDRLPGESRLPVQFTFQKASVTLYVSVIYRRNEYLWRSYMDDVNDSPLIKYDTAFENFTAVRIPTELDLDLYVPSDPVHFLFQMETSPFSLCRSNASAEVQSHPTLTREELENRAAVALQELKAVFHPYFVRFWLWGETRSGFFENCNIFAIVTDLNIAALNSDLETLNATEIFSGNEYLSLLDFSVVDSKLSKISLDCHGLKINLFVAHENGENIDYYEDDGSTTGWRTYFKSEMLSTDVFGQIVYCPHFARVFTKPSASSLHVI